MNKSGRQVGAEYTQALLGYLEALRQEGQALPARAGKVSVGAVALASAWTVDLEGGTWGHELDADGSQGFDGLGGNGELPLSRGADRGLPLGLACQRQAKQDRE